MTDLRQALKDFVATSNSGKYPDEATLLSKFPELQGYDIQALKDFVATSNSGKYATEDELFSKFPEFNISAQKPTEVKKKGDTTGLPSGLGSSASSASADNLSSLAVEVQDKSILTKQPRVEKPIVPSESTKTFNQRVPQFEPQPDEIDRKLEQIEKEKLEQIEQERLALLNNPTPNTEADYFQGTFGSLLRGFDNYSPIGLGDIADDIARAVASGYRSGDVAQASNKIIRSGNEFTDEDIQSLINKQAEFEALGPSKEYQDYYKTYVLEGKTVWGAVKGLMENPTVLPEVAISSLVSMATNREAALAAGGVLAAAFGLGAATGGTAGTFVVPGIGTAVGSTAAGLTTAASSVPFAFGAASTVIETGSVFAQGLQEQLGTDEFGNPIKPTKENVRAILEDPEKYDKIKNDAILRGFTVGIIDAVGGKLATGVGANILRKSAAATGNITKTGLVKSLAAGGVIEGAAGGTGEALGQAVIGKPIDTGNVVLEIAAEMPGALRSTLMASLKVPTYKINKGKVSAEEIDRAISTMTPEELAAADIEIYNDFDGRKKRMQDKIVTGAIANEIREAQPDLNEPTVNALVELQKQLNKLEGNKTQVAKDRAAVLRARIKELQENPLPDAPAPTSLTEELEQSIAEKRKARIIELEDLLDLDFAITQETGRGNLSFDERQEIKQELLKLNAEQDAFQEQEAGQVPVQPTATVGQEVEGGTPQAEPQVTPQEGQEEVGLVPLIYDNDAAVEVAPITTEAAPAQEEIFTLEDEPAPAQEGLVQIEVDGLPTEERPSLRGGITTPDGQKGYFNANTLPDGTAYLSDIQIGFDENAPRGKGFGTNAYIEIGKRLKQLGYNLESTQWDKHTSGISPQALRVWEKLTELGYAKVIGQKENKVYNRETGVEEVKTTPVYQFVEPTAVSSKTQPAPAKKKKAKAAPTPTAPVVEAATPAPTPSAQPIVITDILNDIKISFAPENAIEVQKGTREDTRGKKFTYDAAVTSQVTDRNGTPIGTMTKRSDGEGKLSFTIKDSQGRNINKGKSYNTEGAARTALAEQVNRVRAKAAAQPTAAPAPTPTAPVVEVVAPEPVVVAPAPEPEPILVDGQEAPITVTVKEIKSNTPKFTRDNSIDYEESYKEDSMGREVPYISSLTVEALDIDGEPVGTITRLVDEDKNTSYTAEDVNGNQIKRGEEFGSETEVMQALADHVNKQRKKEFDKEVAKIVKAREKAAAKARLAEEKKAAKQAAKQAAAEAESIINSEETTPDLAERALNVFENLDKTIGNKLKRNANDALLAIPLTTLQAAVKAVKVLIKGGIAVRDAIRRVAAENKINENKLREAFVALTKPVVSDLETEGVGVKLTGEEQVIAGENNPTVKTAKDYKDDYSAEEIFEEEHAPNSRVITTASNIASGQISYTKDGEKITFQLPYLNTNLYKRIQALRNEYKSITGTSKQAKAEKERIKKEINKVAKKVLSDFTDVMSQNLLALYDTLTPEFVKNSKEWYVGANRMANAIADKYNMTVEQVGGIIAALSPQNDWFNNVSVAERTIEIMTKYADTKLTKEIVDKAVKYNSDKSGTPNAFAEILIDLFNKIGEVSINEAQNQNDGTFIQATILRAFDQAINSPKVAITDPTGAFVGFDSTPVRWNSTSEISKAINIFRNGSVENVNENLGNGNKVRNFYNNIVDPNSTTPYVTADTHALSAALNSPISANDAGGFGLFNGSLEPTYSLVKEAYIRAAQVAGILPREMQSITWEAQRIGINDKNRTEAKKQELFDYISQSRKNKETAYERATELIARNRSSDPTWGKGDGIRTQKSVEQIRREARVRAEQRASALSSLRGRTEGRVGTADTAVGERAAGRKGFDEVADLDVKSKDNLAIVSDFLESIDRSISKRLRTNANDALLAIPLTVVQGMVRGINLLVKGGMTVRDAIKKIAADNNISQEKFKDLISLVSIADEFNALMTKADSLIARQRSRGIDENTILSNLDKMVRKFYQDLDVTDTQRKIMEREARAKMGAEPKKSVSIGRVIGALKDITNVTREEKLKIISRIRELSRSAAKELAKDIRAMAAKGQITTAQATNIISKFADVNMLNETSVSNFVDYMTNVFANVKEKNRQSLLNDLLKLVSQKAKAAKTDSGKRRSKGLDDIGQAFFEAIKPIIRAAVNKDVDALQKIRESIDDDLINEIIIKNLNGQELTSRERVLLDQSLAYDTFADVANMDIEQIQALYDQLKDARTESIARLKSKRIERAEQVKALHDEADAQIKAGYSALYNEDGTLKDNNELADDVRDIWNSFNKLKVWDGVKKLFARYDFSVATSVFDFMRKNMLHIGTLSKILDKSGTFFTDNVYRALNNMDEKNLRGYFNERDVLDAMANKIKGITKGFKEFKSKMSNKVITLDNIINTKTGKKRTTIMNQDEAMRIYALYKNPIQREKLTKMGFDEATMQKIEEFIGPEGKQMVDMVVDYFSTDYYESVNKVYRKVNDVSLGYVENYFPTQTISTGVDADMIIDGNFKGIFDAETAPSLKERTDTTGDVALGAGFTSVVDNHIQTMERYKAYAEGVKKINSIFKSPSVQALLGEYGTNLSRVYKSLINFSINPNGGAKIEQSILEKVMTKFTGFALSYKLVQIPKQATSFITAFEKYNYRGQGKKRIPGVDTVMFMVDMAKVIATLPSQVKKAQQISASFKDRLEKGLEGDVYGLESGGRVFRPISKSNTIWGKIVRAFNKGGAAPTVIGDVLGVMGYMINYNRNIANGMSEADALEAFNDYNATQQSRRAADKIPLQQSQNALARSFTMFGSTTFLQINKAVQGMMGIMTNLQAKKMPKAEDMRAVALNVALGNAFFVLAANMAMLIKGDDEDKEKALDRMFEALIGLNLLYQVPLIGGAAEVAIKRAKGDRSPTSDVINPYITVFNKIYKGAKEDDILKAGQPVVEIVLGTQVDQFVGLFNMLGGDFDDNNVYDAVGITKSYRPGGSEPSSSDKKDVSYEDRLEKDLLEGYENKTEMKRYDPDLYEKNFGEGSEYYELTKEEKEEEKQAREEEQKEKDAEYGYSKQSKGFGSRGKNSGKGFGSRSSGKKSKWGDD